MSEPLYRIQAVSKVTGVPAATLRAWERRYNFPSPARTDSAYRLYSEENIELIKQLKMLCNQGMAPSEAVKILKEKLAEDSPSPEYPEGEGLQSIMTAPAVSELEDYFLRAQEQLIEAIHRFDPVLLEKYTRASLLQGSAKQVFDHIFAPVLTRVGNEWHDGILSIAQEHLATESIGNAIRDLLRYVQLDKGTRHIVLACVSGESHSLPLYGSAFHFIQWGYRVTILGVNTPPEALRQAVSKLTPNAIGLSITCPKSIEATRDQLKDYVKACQGLPLIVGGSGASLLKDDLECHDAIVALGSPESVKTLFEARVTKGVQSL